VSDKTYINIRIRWVAKKRVILRFVYISFRFWFGGLTFLLVCSHYGGTLFRFHIMISLSDTLIMRMARLILSAFVRNLFIPVSSLYTSSVSLYFAATTSFELKGLMAIHIYKVGEATYWYHWSHDTFRTK